MTWFIYKYENNSIHYLENIPIGKRIRDIIQLDDGKIVLLTDIAESGESSDENHSEIIIINNSEN